MLEMGIEGLILRHIRKSTPGDKKTGIGLFASQYLRDENLASQKFFILFFFIFFLGLLLTV